MRDMKAVSVALLQVNSWGLPSTMKLSVHGYRREYFRLSSWVVRLTESKQRHLFVTSALKKGISVYL